MTIILPETSIFINKAKNIKARNIVQCVIESENIYDSKSMLSDLFDEGIINYYESNRIYL